MVVDSVVSWVVVTTVVRVDVAVLVVVGRVDVDVVVGRVLVDVVDALVVVVVRVVVTGSLHDAVGGHNPSSASKESTPAAWRPVRSH